MCPDFTTRDYSGQRQGRDAHRMDKLPSKYIITITYSISRIKPVFQTSIGLAYPNRDCVGVLVTVNTDVQQSQGCHHELLTSA